MGETVGGGFRVDGCVFVKDTLSLYDTMEDVAVVAEFKLNKDYVNVQNNRFQLVSAANHIMNDDPCRMWMYGVTIEDEKMSTWYFSRSHSVKSDDFDFREDPETFVHLFLLFLFAEKDEIGFDPTVHRVIEGEKFYYIYEVSLGDSPKKRYFKTSEVIFNRRVTYITGRKTRIWRAREVNGRTKEAEFISDAEVALKDIWLNDGSRTEQDIQSAIYTELIDLKSHPERYSWAEEGLQEHIRKSIKNLPRNLPFMTIQCSGWGKATKERSRAANPDPTILFPEEPPMSPEESGRHVLKESIQIHPPAASGHPGPAQNTAQVQDRQYITKRQYRVVYNEVGYALHDVNNLVAAFDAIKDTFIALVLLFLTGWLHRDVSTGNIILVEDDNGHVRAHLSDFEYAREYDRSQPGESDPKTGTPFFMPVEIHSGCRLRPSPPSQGDLVAMQHQDTASAPDPQPLSFAINPVFAYQHDLKSLLVWTTLWVVLARVDHEPSKTILRYIFTNSSHPSPYRDALFRGAHGDAVEKAIHPALALNPEKTRRFPYIFNHIRGKLYDACIRLPDPPPKDSYYELYNQVSAGLFILKDIADAAGDVHFVAPLPQPLLHS